MRAIYVAILLISVAVAYCSAARYPRPMKYAHDDLGVCSPCKYVLDSGCPCWNVDLCTECCAKDKSHFKCTSSNCDKSQSAMPDWVRRCK